MLTCFPVAVCQIRCIHVSLLGKYIMIIVAPEDSLSFFDAVGGFVRRSRNTLFTGLQRRDMYLKY